MHLLSSISSAAYINEDDLHWSTPLQWYTAKSGIHVPPSQHIQYHKYNWRAALGFNYECQISGSLAKSNITP